MFLLDVQMPKIDGFSLVTMIRAIPGHEETPIMFLTSDSRSENIRNAVALGACDYIVKPVDDEVLCNKVATQIKNYAALRILREYKL